jgi:hypothetical protein
MYTSIGESEINRTLQQNWTEWKVLRNDDIYSSMGAQSMGKTSTEYGIPDAEAANY